jgi:S-methylmethionine-dependent homocysteine/selenocysteine methylase
MLPGEFAARLNHGPLLLDGPTGTELERRGYATSLPLWTALAARQVPALLASLHHDYVRAGADILTACTFRTSRYTLDKAGLRAEAPFLTHESVDLARAAAGTRVLVAGSIAPLEDCYHPERTPQTRVLEREHAKHAENLARAGVDLLLVETMPTAREAEVATRAAVATGKAVITSLLAGAGRTLYDGTPLGSVVQKLARTTIGLIAVNCAPPAWCTEALPALAECGLAFGCYANSSRPDGSFGREPEGIDAGAYAEEARGWLDRGASLVGGCCGTGPAHIEALRQLLDGRKEQA